MAALPGVAVVGLDLSLTATGFAGPEGCETIEPLAGWTTEYDRLVTVTSQIMRRVNEIRPALVVIEGPAYSSRTGKAHERAGLYWYVVDMLERGEIPYAVAPPSAVKKYATSSGGASKETVLIAAVMRLPIAVANNNEADALWLMAMGKDWLGEPIDPKAAKHRASLDSVSWPAEFAKRGL